MDLILVLVMASLSGSLLIFVLIGLWVQRRRERPPASAGPMPVGVSVILPIKGLDPGAADHYRSWLSQRLGAPYEVIFSLQDPLDPVLPVLERLQAEHPGVQARVLVNPVRPGMNGKSSNLHYGVAAARYDCLVMADSDIAPPTDLLARLVPLLMGPGVGLVACLPVVRQARNLWGGAMAMTLNMAITAQWAPQFGLVGARMVGVSGACFAIRREVLEELGGFEAFGGYVAEDAEMGRRTAALGKKVLMGPTVTLEQGEASYEAFTGLLDRGAHLNLYGYGGAPLVTTVVVLFTHLVIILWAALTGNGPLLGAGLVCWLARTAIGVILQVGSERGGGWRYAWTQPVVEVYFLLAFLRALFVRTFQWRGVRYRVLKGGRIEQEFGR